MILPRLLSESKYLLASAIFLVTFSQNLAAQLGSSAAEIRTTFVFHIANYMSLPEDYDNGRNITFCFVEDTPYKYYNLFVKAGIKQLRGLQVSALKIEKIADVPSAECQLAFFGRSKESAALFSALEQFNSRIVTIGETRNFVKKGGIVGLVELQSRVKVLINRQEYDRSSTKFSSLLLRHARFR